MYPPFGSMIFPLKEMPIYIHFKGDFESRHVRWHRRVTCLVNIFSGTETCYHLPIQSYNHIYIYIYPATSSSQPWHRRARSWLTTPDNLPRRASRNCWGNSSQPRPHGQLISSQSKKRGQQSKKLQLVEKNGWLKWINLNMETFHDPTG